ncbi:hypothetical protein AGIG_G4661 [Arapaima gigas]
MKTEGINSSPGPSDCPHLRRSGESEECVGGLSSYLSTFLAHVTTPIASRPSPPENSSSSSSSPKGSICVESRRGADVPLSC